MCCVYILHGLYVFLKDVVLPTVDSYSDASSVIQFYSREVYEWATAMLVPIAVNVIFSRYPNNSSMLEIPKYNLYTGLILGVTILHYISSYIWYKCNLDSAKEKRWTWILLPLLLWPQYQALKITKGILTKQGKLHDEKDLEREREVPVASYVLVLRIKENIQFYVNLF